MTKRQQKLTLIQIYVNMALLTGLVLLGLPFWLAVLLGLIILVQIVAYLLALKFSLEREEQS